MKLLATLLALSIAGCAIPGESREGGTEADVTAATAAWVTAYNSRDPARITALYDRDAVLWGTVSSSIKKGPGGSADYFKDAGKRPDARVTLVDQVPRVYGDTAVNSGAYTFTDVRDGKNVSNPARFSFVFRKRGGRWLIVDHHSSRMPGP